MVTRLQPVGSNTLKNFFFLFSAIGMLYCIDYCGFFTVLIIVASSSIPLHVKYSEK